MSKKIISLSIIILTVILVFQSYNIYNKSYSGYMFNTKYQTEKINIDYVVLSYNLLTIKGIIPNNSDTVLSVFINDVDSKYNTALQYWFNKRNFYPIVMPREHNFVPLLDYSNDKFGKSIIRNKVDYVVLVGKNSSILNVTTKKDISLYKVISSTELSLVVDYDNTLSSLEENSKKINKSEYLDEVLEYIKTYEKNYHNEYSMAPYKYIYDYLVYLTENNREDEALEYYKMYLSLSSLDSEVILNKANIYVYENDYNNAKFYFDYCNSLGTCNINIMNELQKKINNLEVK